MTIFTYANPIMIHLNKAAGYLASPSLWIWIWTLNFWAHIDTQLIPILAELKFSLLITITSVLAIVKNIPISKFTWRPKDSDLALAIPILALTLFPLLSALPSLDEKNILAHPPYKALIKHLVIILLYASSLANQRVRKALIASNITGVVILAITLHIRFFVFDEARIDGRPLLNQNISDPNFMACIFASFIPITAVFFSTFTHKYKKLATILISLLFLESILLTESRMGIIAVIACLFSMTRLIRSEHRNRFIFICIFSVGFLSLILFLSPMGHQIIERFSTFDDESNSLRLRTLRAGINVFMNAPMLGVGIDGVRDIFLSLESYARLQTEAMELNVHNTFIKILSEHGILGFTLFLLLPASIISASFSPRFKRDHRIYLQSSIIALVANSLTLPLDIQDWLHQTIGCLLVLTVYLQGFHHEKNWT